MINKNSCFVLIYIVPTCSPGELNRDAGTKVVQGWLTRAKGTDLHRHLFGIQALIGEIFVPSFSRGYISHHYTNDALLSIQCSFMQFT